jgi:hypothetical protein
MRVFIFLLIFVQRGYAQDSLKRLEEELKYLQDREAFLYLPKKDLLIEKADEVKTTSSAILKPYPEEAKDDLLKELEQDSGFREVPINSPEIN